MAAEELQSRTKKTLSKNLLGMKFMKRKAEADHRRQLEEERQRAIEESHWVVDDRKGEQNGRVVEIEPSYVICEELYPSGRLSFWNFNPVVEKMFKEMLAKEDMMRSEAREKEESVSDEEMARRYESLVDTVAKKFSTKRNRSASHMTLDSQSPSVTQPSKKARREFMKPYD